MSPSRKKVALSLGSVLTILLTVAVLNGPATPLWARTDPCDPAFPYLDFTRPHEFEPDEHAHGATDPGSDWDIERQVEAENDPSWNHSQTFFNGWTAEAGHAMCTV